MNNIKVLTVWSVQIITSDSLLSVNVDVQLTRRPHATYNLWVTQLSRTEMNMESVHAA